MSFPTNLRHNDDRSTNFRRSDREALSYWRDVFTSEPISKELRELIREDLRKKWHFSRLENFRWRVKVNWGTVDDQLVLLNDEKGAVTLKQLLLFCNKITAFYWLQTAQSNGASGERRLMPRIVFATIYREWSQYYDFQPNIEFGRYIANPIRITPNGPSTIRGVLEAHHSLCMQARNLMAKARQDDGLVYNPLRTELRRYDIHPLYKAIILLIDRYEIDFQSDLDGLFSLEDAAQQQTVLIVRTGLEAGLSAKISFDSLRAKSLPLDRSDMGGQPVLDIVRTSLTTAVRFILDLEKREIIAHPESAQDCAWDPSINPGSPIRAVDGSARHDPNTWADALIEAAEKYGYDDDPITRNSIRRVQAAMVGENFGELTPIPFGNKWKE
ncbi:MAG: hypothetical protein Q9164_006116 [Protoblastenia rupestris]